ncbi:hypothetical protein PIB30_076910 [Stylosanthes scabra]|uniref:Uncharacterized protein n=1 Tax=Stylosanthes scabra TaxID=79078 RepID=A0ABU6RR54_9FABA|nr:hypothetical protein [Stylosanthes scabra]
MLMEISRGARIQGKSGFNVTIGTIKEVGTEYGWWYRSCKDRTCAKSLKDIGGKYKCDDVEKNLLTSCLVVVDETESMSLIVFEHEVQNFLKKSCNEIRHEIFEKGLSEDIFPEEICAFKEKNMLFKVNVKVVNINSYQPCTYHVYKLSQDKNLILAFKEKFKIDSVACLENTSDDLQSLDDTSKTPKSFENSCEIILPMKRNATDVTHGAEGELERSVTSNVKSRRLVDEDGEKGEMPKKYLLWMMAFVMTSCART